MYKTYVSLFLFMLLFALSCIYLIYYTIRISSNGSICFETNTPAKADQKIPIPEKFETAYETISTNPNEFALKYINLPYEYSFGSNSIPLAVSGYIGNGDILELGIVSKYTIFCMK